MASDLTGMFNQLNKAITGMPSVQPMVDMMSQGAGNMLAPAFNKGLPEGRQMNSMQFMNEGAQEKESTEQLAELDMNTSEGLLQAAQIYAQMGEAEKALQMTTLAGDKKEKQVTALEASGAAFTAEAQRKRGIATALERGDKEGANAIRGGLISPQDYYKTLFKSQVETAAKVAGRDPYAGAFTETITMGDKQVPVRFKSNGDPLAVLGEGRADFDIQELYDPSIGATRQAIISKTNPGQYQWLGEGEAAAPSYDIKEVNGKFHTWMTPPNGGPPVRVSVDDTLTDAEKNMANAKSSVKTVNLMSSIDKALNMIDMYGDDAFGVGGMSGLLEYLPGTQARGFKSLIDSIGANVGFDSLKTLKAEGGTLGQVSNIENMLLQAEIAKLDTWTSADDIANSLNKIRNISERIHVAETTGNPDALMAAEMDSNGQPTGNKLYQVDPETIAVVYPDGQIEMVLKGK